MGGRAQSVAALIVTLALTGVLSADAGTDPTDTTINAHGLSLVDPTNGDLYLRVQSADSNPSSNDGHQGASITAPGGVIRGIRDIEGGRSTNADVDAGLDIGAGDATHRGVLTLNPDIGREVRIDDGHGHMFVKVDTQGVQLLDGDHHAYVRVGPGGVDLLDGHEHPMVHVGKTIRFYRRPKIKR